MRVNTVLGGGLVAAVLGSLCCITPVIALIAGTTSVAASFSWLEPLRPYLVGVTITVLGFSWYQKLFPKKSSVPCECDSEPKNAFMQSKSFLTILTCFAFATLAFPHYAHVFYPNDKTHEMLTNNSNLKIVEFRISGMTCQGCAEHVKYEVNQLAGVLKVEASYEKGNAVVEFDDSVVSFNEIEQAINQTGYRVVDRLVK